MLNATRFTTKRVFERMEQKHDGGGGGCLVDINCLSGCFDVYE